MARAACLRVGKGCVARGSRSRRRREKRGVERGPGPFGRLGGNREIPRLVPRSGRHGGRNEGRGSRASGKARAACLRCTGAVPEGQVIVAGRFNARNPTPQPDPVATRRFRLSRLAHSRGRQPTLATVELMGKRRGTGPRPVGSRGGNSGDPSARASLGMTRWEGARGEDRSMAFPSRACPRGLAARESMVGSIAGRNEKRRRQVDRPRAAWGQAGLRFDRDRKPLPTLTAVVGQRLPARRGRLKESEKERGRGGAISGWARSPCSAAA